MSLVYEESSVKQPGFFSIGEPEPKIRSGELLIYVNEKEEHFQVEAERTPVSNAFIKKNKINRRIRMQSGPFPYVFSKELFTQDHRKYVKVDLNIVLEVEEAYKLYNSEIKDITTYLNNFIPGELASIVSTYTVEDIIRLQYFLQDMTVFPTFASRIKSLGLRVAQYTTHVEKDSLETELDRTSRIREDENKAKIQDRIQEKFNEADVEIAGALAQASKLEKYKKLLDTTSPDLAIRYIPEEDQDLVREHWKKQGLQIDVPKEDPLKTPFD